MVPCSDIQLAAVDDGGELKHDREPGLHPNTVRVPCVFLIYDKQLKNNNKIKVTLLRHHSNSIPRDFLPHAWHTSE